jgi:hypothetical protein
MRRPRANHRPAGAAGASSRANTSATVITIPIVNAVRNVIT